MAVVRADYRGVVGISLNIPKSSAVALWQARDNDVRDILTSDAPEWGGIKTVEAMEYLGVMVGPGRKDSSWTAPIQKYTERGSLLGLQGPGHADYTAGVQSLCRLNPSVCGSA